MTAIESVQAIGSGYFMVDGLKMSFEDLIMKVQMSNVETADKVFAGRFSEIEERNKKISLMNDMLQVARKYQDNFDKDGKLKEGKSASFTGSDLDTWNKFHASAVSTGLVRTDIPGGGGPFSKQQLETLLDNTRSGLDNLNSQNEMDMMKLNKLGNQRSSYVQLLSSMLSTVKEARGAAVR